MAGEPEPRVKEKLDRLSAAAESSGYHVNPDADTTIPLVEGLLTNIERYGYQLCPCRLTGGSRESDVDIICPCDYRDPDLAEYDTCYCGLYVSERVLEGEAQVGPIPERREARRDVESEGSRKPEPGGGGVRVWRCRVCGYLCARGEPPEKCPVCKVESDRFEEFEVRLLGR